MTDKRLEAIARAIYEASPACYHVPTNPVPWDDAAPPYKEQAFREAQAAISSYPVTEDVKQLVEMLKLALSHCLLWQGEPDEYSCEIHKAVVNNCRNELKKWSGE